MSTLLLVNANGPEKRVALVENGQLAELFMERRRDRGLVGNVYKGRVVRILPGMQAAFVEIGVGRAAFLYVADAGGLDGDYKHLFYADAEEREEQDVLPREELTRAVRQPPIQDRIKEGQEIVVQVAKDPIGTKGARVTTYISLPGRHLVFMPTVDHVGISRRILQEQERRRLREIVEQIRPPGAGFIVRTVAEGQPRETLEGDMQFLLKLWQEVLEREAQAGGPTLLYQELDLTLRAVRDLFSSEVDQLIVDHPTEFERLGRFLDTYAPRFRHLLSLHNDPEPLFDYYDIELEVDRSLERKVWLKSGGYLIIDQGEALTSIDVNTGRYVGRRNLEDTITRTNLEAVREVAHQLRLRNIGGIIVIDFIDMERESNREKVWSSLVEALKKDRAKSNVLKISEFGLVEMTRKRVKESLVAQLTEPCPYCEGRGYVKSDVTVCYEVLGELRRQLENMPGPRVDVLVHPAVAELLAASEHEHLSTLERRFGKTIVVTPRPDFHCEQYEINV